MAETSNATGVVETGLPRPTATVHRLPVTGGRSEVGTPVTIDPRDLHSRVGQAERDAILESLYTERKRLLRAKRLGEALPGDDEYLHDLSQYIDEWEAFEDSAAATSNVWAKLEELAATALVVQAEVVSHKKK